MTQMDKLNNLPKMGDNPKEHKSITRRNKNAGYGFETQIVAILKEMGYEHAVLSRTESVDRDRDKVDIMNRAEGKNGRLPWNFQCKSINASKIPYPKLLDIMPKGEEINIVLHNRTKREVGKNIRFVTQGQYAILNMKDLFTMLTQMKNLEEGFQLLNEHFDSIPADQQAAVAAALTKLGL